MLFLYIVLDEGKTIDHNYYIEKSVVDKIWKQRRLADTKGTKLLEDNARPLMLLII